MELVRWGNEYLADLIRLGADPRVVEYINDGKPWTADYATERHGKALAHWEVHGFGWSAAIVGGTFVGLGSMADRGEEGIEIGWWVDPDHWGKGIATAMATLLRDDVLSRGRRVTAGFLDGNAASERVMVKIGMTYQRSLTSFGRLKHLYALEKT